MLRSKLGTLFLMGFVALTTFLLGWFIGTAEAQPTPALLCVIPKEWGVFKGSDGNVLAFEAVNGTIRLISCRIGGQILGVNEVRRGDAQPR